MDLWHSICIFRFDPTLQEVANVGASSIHETVDLVADRAPGRIFTIDISKKGKVQV